MIEARSTQAAERARHVDLAEAAADERESVDPAHGCSSSTERQRKPSLRSNAFNAAPPPPLTSSFERRMNSN
jgi:hypothetical protein